MNLTKRMSKTFVFAMISGVAGILNLFELLDNFGVHKTGFSIMYLIGIGLLIACNVMFAFLALTKRSEELKDYVLPVSFLFGSIFIYNLISLIDNFNVVDLLTILLLIVILCFYILDFNKKINQSFILFTLLICLGTIYLIVDILSFVGLATFVTILNVIFLFSTEIKKIDNKTETK